MSENDALAPAIPETMCAVLLTGHGGLDKLEYRTDVPVPTPKEGEVLIHVLACGVNNTDVNTRIGWYSRSVKTETNEGAEKGGIIEDGEIGSWTGSPLAFPLIQGADVCGRIVAVGDGVEQSRIGDRVIVASMQASFSPDDPWTCLTMGSEFNGGFAQFVTTRSSTAYRVESEWDDCSLASIPCAWSTAENLLIRTSVSASDRVLITGASGGVGSALVQLAKLRGARVVALVSASKADRVLALGADEVVHRGEGVSLVDGIVGGEKSVDVVCDVVAGPTLFPDLLAVLKHGGRYGVVGAIAGPLVELDVRSLYLKDLSFFGATVQAKEVMPNLVRYIEANEIRPTVGGTFPLEEIAKAQTAFLQKKFVGKLVLVPPSL